MEVKVKMDYQKELEELQKGSNYWKPEVGQFKVKALSELEESTPFKQERSDGSVEEKPQMKLNVSVDGSDEKIWTFGKGQTQASTYGQLVELAAQNNNTLKGVEFTLVVKSDGKKKNFTIVK